MAETVIDVQDVSVKFNLGKEKIDTLKEFVIKFLKGQIKYDEFWALQNVSFNVERGERLGILGLNGAGKTTLLKTISGVYKPTSGNIKVKGNIAPLLELGAGFDPNYTGRENIFLYGAVLGYSKKYLQQKYDEIVEFSELGKFIDVPLKNYSSGMRARLGFSVATVVSPEILILDEVLSVGDAKFQRKCQEKIMGMFDSGMTVLFVSHSLSSVRKLCTKAMILEHGKVISFGDSETVCNQYEEMVK